MTRHRYCSPIAIFMVLLLALPSFGPAQAHSDISIKAGPKFGDVTVTNHGVAASLRTRIEIEWLDADKETSAYVANFELRQICGQLQEPKCTNLAANQTMHVVPWTGMTCGSQCPIPCAGNRSAIPGIYRYVVHSCDGKRTYVSPAFEKKPTAEDIKREEIFKRWREDQEKKNAKLFRSK